MRIQFQTPVITDLKYRVLSKLFITPNVRVAPVCEMRLRHCIRQAGGPVSHSEVIVSRVGFHYATLSAYSLSPPAIGSQLLAMQNSCSSGVVDGAVVLYRI